MTSRSPGRAKRFEQRKGPSQRANHTGTCRESLPSPWPAEAPSERKPTLNLGLDPKSKS